MPTGPHEPPPWAQQLKLEIERSFDWLIESVEPNSSVTFVPNPGNIGDAAINLACWTYLSSKYNNAVICGINDTPIAEHVFIGGGGNLVEPLYINVSLLLQRLAPHQRVYIFPSTIYGYSDVLKKIHARTRILCRDELSHRFVQDHVPADSVRLTHDAAFIHASELQADYANRIALQSELRGRLFRNDRERAIAEEGGLDVMGLYHSDWTNMKFARRALALATNYILGFGHIQTDRLHCAILSAMLSRETILYPGSYFKNAAVFDLSLSHFPNVSLAQPKHFRAQLEIDPVAYRQQHRANAEKG